MANSNALPPAEREPGEIVDSLVGKQVKYVKDDGSRRTVLVIHQVEENSLFHQVWWWFPYLCLWFGENILDVIMNWAKFVELLNVCSRTSLEPGVGWVLQNGDHMFPSFFVSPHTLLVRFMSAFLKITWAFLHTTTTLNSRVEYSQNVLKLLRNH